MVAWIVVLVIAVPLFGLLAWLLLDDALVRIEPGDLGLVVVRGKATNRSLVPGPHLVPAFRRTTVQQYPALELVYRTSSATAVDIVTSDLESVGPALRVVMGDRSEAVIGYTVRFQLDPDRLKLVHQRFGREGIWSAVRDSTSVAIRTKLREPKVSIDKLVGPAAKALELNLSVVIHDALDACGLQLVAFSFGDLDLGYTGEVMQATARARFELEREEAEAATRLAKASIDAQMQPSLAMLTSDLALRYREVDAWRDVARSLGDHRLAAPALSPSVHAANRQQPPSDDAIGMPSTPATDTDQPWVDGQ